MPRRVLLLNLLAILWCFLILNVRMHLAGHHNYAFLLWNLFLAVIPLDLSLGVAKTNHIFLPPRCLPRGCCYSRTRPTS